MKTILILLLLLVPLHGQQTWKVNCNGGPGVDFTDLPPAVAAASPGDTILVYWLAQSPCAQGFSYTATTINKPLRIEGFFVDTVNPPPPTSAPSTPLTNAWRGVMTVTGLAVGQQVTISHMLVNNGSYSGSPSGIRLVDCAGPVLLEGCILNSGGFSGLTVEIIRCQDVTLRDTAVSYGGVPVHIEDSRVLMTTCLVRGEPPFPSVLPGLPPPYTQMQSPALRMIRSDVTVVGSGLRGFSRNCNTWPQAGVELQQSTLRIGPAAHLIGCTNGIGSYASGYWPGGGTTQGISVLQDPRVYFVSPSVPTATTAWIHSTFHSRLVAGYPYGVTVSGPPDGFALLALGELSPTPVQVPFGALAFNPSTALVVDLVHLPPPGGYSSWNLQCPSSAPVAYPFVFQALTLSATGEFGVTVPSPLTVGWQHGVLP